MTIEDDLRDGSSAASASLLSRTEEEPTPDSAPITAAEDEDDSGSIFGLRPPRNAGGGEETARNKADKRPSDPDANNAAGEPLSEESAPGAFFSSPGDPAPSASFPAMENHDETASRHNAWDELSGHDDFFTCPSEADSLLLDQLADDAANGECQELTADLDDGPDDAFLLPETPQSFENSDLSAVFAEGKEPRWLGVRFRKNGQVYYIPDQEHLVRKGTKVLVKQESGPALGEVESVVEGAMLPPGKDISSPGKKILGVATAQDIARHTENSILADEAEAFCKTCIRQRALDMKLVDVEVLHDRSKIIFYFTAPSRIDFRELVKDLVRNYRTRIELRQIGVRHESQMIGGLGNCGMVCCCHRYLRKFAPVTIKMAKEQNLFLNPAKLSGMCGRLLCCLSFEQGNYEEFNRRCPKIGKKYVTEDNKVVKILRANMFSQTICVHSESGEEWELSLEDWDQMKPRRAEPGQQPDAGRAAEQPQGDHQGGRKHKKYPGREDARPREEAGDESADAETARADGQAPRKSGGRAKPHKRARHRE